MKSLIYLLPIISLFLYLDLKSFRLNIVPDIHLETVRSHQEIRSRKSRNFALTERKGSLESIHDKYVLIKIRYFKIEKRNLNKKKKTGNSLHKT